MVWVGQSEFVGSSSHSNTLNLEIIELRSNRIKIQDRSKILKNVFLERKKYDFFFVLFNLRVFHKGKRVEM